MNSTLELLTSRDGGIVTTPTRLTTLSNHNVKMTSPSIGLDQPRWFNTPTLRSKKVNRHWIHRWLDICGLVLKELAPKTFLKNPFMLRLWERLQKLWKKFARRMNVYSLTGIWNYHQSRTLHKNDLQIKTQCWALCTGVNTHQKNKCWTTSANKSVSGGAEWICSNKMSLSGKTIFRPPANVNLKISSIRGK